MSDSNESGGCVQSGLATVVVIGFIMVASIIFGQFGSFFSSASKLFNSPPSLYGVWSSSPRTLTIDTNNKTISMSSVGSQPYKLNGSFTIEEAKDSGVVMLHISSLTGVSLMPRGNWNSGDPQTNDLLNTAQELLYSDPSVPANTTLRVVVSDENNISIVGTQGFVLFDGYFSRVGSTRR